MAEIKELNDGQKRLLRLINKDADAAGWVIVSTMVYPMLSKLMPNALVECAANDEDEGGRVRLTAEGHSVLNNMEWL